MAARTGRRSILTIVQKHRGLCLPQWFYAEIADFIQVTVFFVFRSEFRTLRDRLTNYKDVLCMFLFSRCTCEFTVVKSRFSVVSVLKLSLNPGTSLRMSGSTQEKNHISVKSAGNVSPSPRRTRITCTYTSNYVWTRSMRKPRPIIPINLLNFTQEKLWKACKQFVLIWLRINTSGILRFLKLRALRNEVWSNFKLFCCIYSFPEVVITCFSTTLN